MAFWTQSNPGQNGGTNVEAVGCLADARQPLSSNSLEGLAVGPGTSELEGKASRQMQAIRIEIGLVFVLRPHGAANASRSIVGMGCCRRFFGNSFRVCDGAFMIWRVVLREAWGLHEGLLGCASYQQDSIPLLRRLVDLGSEVVWLLRNFP